MDQIFHILRKDVKRLWREIVAVTIVTLLLAWLNGDNRLILPVSRREQALYGLRNLLLPLNAGAWWFLILSLIHEEAIPGIHQFWLTRPYRRGALLGAKLLFIFLFVNLPVLLADAIALLRSGVPFEWTGILWKQVLFSAVVPLPAMAMAAVTAGLSQAILGMLGLSVLTALLAMIPGVEYGLPGGMGWWNAGAGLLSIVAAGPLLLYWQFHRRMTTHSRLLVLAVTVAFSLAALLLPWRTAFAWQQRLARQPGTGAGYTVQPELERGRLSPEGDMRPSAETARIALPVDHRLPAGLDMLGDGVELAFSTPDGARARMETGMGTWTESHGKPWIIWTLDREEFKRWRSRPLRVDATVYATLFGNAHTARFHFGETDQSNPPWGVCGAADRAGAAMVWCRGAYSPALWTRVKLRDRETGASSRPVWLSSANYAPFHVDPGISPLNIQLSRFTLPALHREEENSWNSGRLGVTDVEFNGLEPLDHVIRPVRFDSVKLEDFEVIEPR